MHSDFSLNNNQTIVEYDKGFVYEAQARMSCVVRVVLWSSSTPSRFLTAVVSLEGDQARFG